MDEPECDNSGSSISEELFMHMPKFKSKRTKLASIIGGVVLVAGISAGVASASIPDAGGTIHGCYRTTTGTLRVIDTGGGGSCLGDETSLNWSQGPATAGSGGLGVTVVSAATSANVETVQCPGAEPYVIGGGGDATASGSVYLTASEPWNFGTNNALTGSESSSGSYGWRTASNTAPSALYVFAICSA